MLEPHPHLCNRAVFQNITTKSGNPGHNRDIGPNFRTVGNYAIAKYHHYYEHSPYYDLWYDSTIVNVQLSLQNILEHIVLPRATLLK